jgi:hypothetical protein
MDSTIRIKGLPGVTHEAGHAQYIEALRRDLSERGHAAQTVRSYGNCAGHFLRWAQGERLDVGHIDEAAAARFSGEHLTRCTCGWPIATSRRTSP